MNNRFFCIFAIAFLFLSGCDTLGVQATPPTEQPKPSEIVIINLLNGYLANMDPIGEVLDADYLVMDVTYDKNENNKEKGINITIKCERNCSWERTFSVLMMALRAQRDGVKAVAPATLKDFQAITMKGLAPTGTVRANWQNVLDYLDGGITGAQLVNRLIP